MSKQIAKTRSDRDIYSEITPEVATVIRDLPEPKKKIILREIYSRQKHYSGPLPDGETIQIYNQVIPDGGNRLMQTVEKQVEHRIELEKNGVKRSFNQSSTGQ